MNPRSLRVAARRLAVGTALLTCGAFRIAAADPRIIDDGTTADAWRLSNGLRVTSRHVPGTTGVAITVLYEVGTDDDPTGQEGLASLAAEVAFTGAVGDVPPRSREEMGSIRPLGWNLKVAPRYTALGEIASIEQFPGALHQIAARMRGVTLTEPLLRAAKVTVKAELARTYAHGDDIGAHHALHLLAGGRGTETVARYATGKGVERVTVREVSERLQALYVPANAVLSLAGNLTGVDARRLVENTFGALPSGPAPPARTPWTAAGESWRIADPGVQQPFTAVGVIAPALSDTSHPSFFLHSLVIGSMCKQDWEPPAPPLTSRFEYSILDDPGLVRFYPPPVRDSIPVPSPLWVIVSQLEPRAPQSENLDKLERGIEWLLGGPLPVNLLRQMRQDPSLLYVLGSGMAVREAWGSEAFWAEYRRRFRESGAMTMKRWIVHYSSTGNVVDLRYDPPR